jgi:hypothetical protein
VRRGAARPGGSEPDRELGGGATQVGRERERGRLMGEEEGVLCVFYFTWVSKENTFAPSYTVQMQLKVGNTL